LTKWVRVSFSTTSGVADAPTFKSENVGAVVAVTARSS
jgi:hypothetical protein